MRQNRKLFRARRTLVTATATAGVALGLVATTAVAAASPVSAPVAASLTSSFASPAAATVASASKAIEAVTTTTDDAQASLDGARTTLDDAAALRAEISTSGLDLGDSTIDTAGLREAILDLAKSSTVPVLLFPTLADDASTESEAVSIRVTELRSSLETARAEKAAADAAAQAQAEAEAAAAAAAAEAQAAADALAAANTVEGAKATAARMAADVYGWGSDQFSCLASLWTKESGWNYRAVNTSGGATGIPQALPGSKMASAGSDWQTNATTQITWGLDYIDRAYGSPCAAWGKSQAVNWY